MRLTYFQKIIFSGLEVISGCINLIISLLGLSPTCDLDGNYLKHRIEKIHSSTLDRTSQQREKADNEYRARVNELTSR
tara:strand:- start:2060 stop:2293 length:234 start_codon:yes stop_codon:yes gene_type:complete